MSVPETTYSPTCKTCGRLMNETLGGYFECPECFGPKRKECNQCSICHLAGRCPGCSEHGEDPHEDPTGRGRSRFPEIRKLSGT